MKWTLLFKHSYRCPISRAAKAEVDAFKERHTGELKTEEIDVIGNRARSRQVSEATGIPHESPQVILLDSQGRVHWHASHHGIRVEALDKALGEPERGA